MNLERPVVQLSYSLAESDRYQAAKRAVHGVLEDRNSRIRLYFDSLMIVLVLLSVSMLVYDTYGDTGRFGALFERLVVSLFIIEYLLRFWIASDNHRIIIDHFERANFVNEPFRLWPAVREALARKWAYVSSFYAIVDLLAIIPTYRPVRLLRLFVLFRLLKLFRYADSLAGFGRVLLEKRFELMALSVFLAFIIFSAASALVIFEVENPDSHINSFWDGIYWALITVSTVGYGDIVPATPEGRLVAIMLILAGLGTFSFLASIIVTAFSERLPELQVRQGYGELERRGGHTIVCGFGRVAEEVAKLFAREEERFVVVDSSEERYRLARRSGYQALHGKAESEEMLDALHVESARRILCLTNDDVVNLYITVSARYRNPAIDIIAVANHPGNTKKLQRAGADHTVSPFDNVGSLAVQCIGQPVAFDAVLEVMTAGQGIGVDAIRIADGSPLIGSTVGELRLEAHKLVLFGVISGRQDAGDFAVYQSPDASEGQFYFNPGPHFCLELNDVMVIFGHQLSVSHLRKRLAELGQ
jgi:voltage-gated potassium channel